MEEEFYKNQFGIKIYKCCASCINKQFKGENRVCAIRKRRVDKSDVCGEWTISDGLDNAGSELGSVKDIKYMMFMLNKHLEETYKEDAAEDRGEKYTRCPASQFTSEWLKTHDTIYILP